MLLQALLAAMDSPQRLRLGQPMLGSLVAAAGAAQLQLHTFFQPALQFEQQCLAEQPELLTLLKRERVEPARRALLLQPQNMRWNWWDDVTVELRFWLPAGSFATSVVREIMLQDNGDADITE